MAITKDYQTITLEPGFEAYGAPYAPPQSISYINSDQAGEGLYTQIKLEGLIKFTGEAPKTNTKIGKLGIYHNPKYQMSFPCVTDNGTVRIQITSDGDIIFRQGTAKGYIFLDGINFDHNPYFG